MNPSVLGWSGGGLQPPSTAQSPTRPNMQQQVQVRRSITNFNVNHPDQQQHQVLLQQPKQQQRIQQEGPFVAPGSSDFRTGMVSATDSSVIWDDQSSDPVLSQILDQVIDTLPDTIMSGKHTIYYIFKLIDNSKTLIINIKVKPGKVK